jgi:hypothetical protein
LARERRSVSRPEASSVFVLRRSKGCKTPEARLSRVAARVRGACIHTRCASLQTKIPCWDAGCCCWPFIHLRGRAAWSAASAADPSTGTRCLGQPNGSLLFRDVGGSGLGLRRAKKETIAGRLPQHLSETLGGSASHRLLVNRSLLQSNRAASAAGWAATVFFNESMDAVRKGSYLVDPASSHMLVSKIKPCMSKYKLLYTVKLRMAH